MLLRRRQVPFLSVDVLKMALHDVLPQQFPAPGLPHDDLAASISPLLRSIGMHAVAQGRVYCLEGDLLAPGDVAQFARLMPGKVRACFLGFPAISTAEKLNLIERFPAEPLDWVNRDLNREQKVAHIDHMKLLGARLELACRAVDVPFVDTSDGFGSSLERAYGVVTG